MEDALTPPPGTIAQNIGLVELLTLDESADTPDVFGGPTQWRTAPSVYGGQLVGQAAIAAARTIDGPRAAHAMHAFFLRGGDFTRPIRYVVERLQEGRSFARRRVQAFQDDSVIFSTIVSFQHEQPGLSHQVAMPDGIDAPESLAPATPSPSLLVSGLEGSFDIRRVPDGRLPDDGTGRRATWMRVLDPVPDDEHFHRAALAYASDFELFVSAMVRHRVDWGRQHVTATSLDHSLWWHAPVRVDEWLLFVRESPQSGDSRGLTTGRFYTRDGVQVATAAQEGLMRIAAP